MKVDYCRNTFKLLRSNRRKKNNFNENRLGWIQNIYDIAEPSSKLSLSHFYGPARNFNVTVFTALYKIYQDVDSAWIYNKKEMGKEIVSKCRLSNSHQVGCFAHHATL